MTRTDRRLRTRTMPERLEEEEARRQMAKERFILALMKEGIVEVACHVAEISSAAVYRYRDQDAEFANAWRDAVDYATGKLEQSLYRRAMDPKNASGTTAAIFLLKGRKPHMYRERYDVTHGGEVTVVDARSALKETLTLMLGEDQYELLEQEAAEPGPANLVGLLEAKAEGAGESG